MKTLSAVKNNARAVSDFVTNLKPDENDHKKNEDRGTLALLRGGLCDSEGRRMRVWRVLARFIPADDPHEADVVRNMAGLLALQYLHHEANEKSFGHACRWLLGDEELKSLSKPEQIGPVGRRVEHLLSATREEICDRVSRLGRRLDSAHKNRSLDFIQLYTDLYYWQDHGEAKTKARWAAGFWGASDDDTTTAPEAKL